MVEIVQCGASWSVALGWMPLDEVDENEGRHEPVIERDARSNSTGSGPLPVKLADDACEDRDDVKFLACALGAQAKYVITGDRALLRASGYQGIEVVTPRRFVAQHLT